MLEIAAALCAGAALSVAALSVALPRQLTEMPARAHLRTAVSSLVAHEAELASSSGWSWLHLSNLLLIELASALLAAVAAWMFTGLPVLGIPSAAGAVTLVRFIAGARSRTRRRERQDAVLEAVRMLRQVLEAGAGGLQQAITALAERGPLPLRSEFRLIAATSVGRRQAWRAARERVGEPLFDMQVMLWTTTRFQPMVNGNSGFYPVDQAGTKDALKAFPDQGSVDLLHQLGVKTVVPMHFATFPILDGRPSQLQELVGPGIKVLDIKPGDTV